MSDKSENWKEKLEQVRASMVEEKVSVEQTADDILNKEIEEELELFDIDLIAEMTSEELLQLDEESMEDKLSKLFRIKDKKALLGLANLMNMTSPKVLQSMQKQNPKGFERMAKKMGELPAMEEVEEENNSVEKDIHKLVERNMLGRLAKRLKLNKEGKRTMFKYFEEGKKND